MTDAPPSTSPFELFRPQALEAVASRYGRPVRTWEVSSTAMVLGLIAIAGAAAADLGLSRFHRKEVVYGSIEPVAGSVRVAVPKPGVITELLVHDGDLVARGQPIATVSTDLNTSWGAPVAAAVGAEIDREVDSISQGADARAAATQAQILSLRTKQSALQRDLSRLQSDLEIAAQKADLAKTSLQSATKLNGQGWLSDLELRQRQNAVLDEAHARLTILGQIEAARAELAGIPEEIRRLKAENADGAAQAALATAQAREKALVQAADHEVAIVAPRAGRVVSLLVKRGAAVAGNTTLATIVPAQGGVEADVWAPSRAIGMLRPGQPVRLMLDAFPFQRFGAARGRVSEIAAAPTAPGDLPVDSKEALYKVVVRLDRQTIGAYGRQWTLAPGNRLSADILLESESFWDWLIEPLRAVRGRA